MQWPPEGPLVFASPSLGLWDLLAELSRFQQKRFRPLDLWGEARFGTIDPDVWRPPLTSQASRPVVSHTATPACFQPALRRGCVQLSNPMARRLPTRV